MGDTAWTLTIGFGQTAEALGFAIKVAAVDVDVDTVTLELAPIAGAAPDKTFRRTYRLPASCPREAEAQVLALAGVWCRAVARLTVLNQSRFSALHARLSEYGFETLREAIEEYGRSAWHREKKAWLDLAKWAHPERLDTWVDKARQRALATEKQAHNKQPISTPVRRLVDGVADAATPRTEGEELLDRFRDLPPAEQEPYFLQAIAELREFRIYRAASLQPNLKCGPVAAQIAAILKRQRARENSNDE